MKLLGIVVFYYPDAISVIDNIEKYINLLTHLVIWNNTPNTNSSEYEYMFKNKDYLNKIEFLGGRGNLGLSIPINYAIRKTIKDCYDALLTMDQDSIWVNFDEYVDIISKQNFLYNVYEPSVNVKKSDKDIEDMYFDRIINSGMIYGREALISVGYMNELLFVEGIDTEYGYRILINNKVKLYKVHKAILNQHMDKKPLRYVFPNVFRKFGCVFAKQSRPCKYNAKRLYGITYSIMIIKREFPGIIGNIELKALLRYYGTRAVFIPILLYGDQKMNRFFWYFKGLYDGLRANVKKYDTSNYKLKEWTFL